MTLSRKVAVIGAGVAGLVAACELRHENHQVTIFEKSHHIGGTWVYDPHPDSDPSGRDPHRRVVHSSLYGSLRTNLPRQLMGFLDFPLDRCYGDDRTFPGHREMLSFLEDFGREFGVDEVVRLGTEVVRVETRGEKWVVEWRQEGEAAVEEVFEAVVVCNGHFTEPILPEIAGIDTWPGKQIHSHNYRTPEQFQDLIVVTIGYGASAYDISREISKVARSVHLAIRSTEIGVGKMEGHDNIWHHSMVKVVHEDGKVDFHDGSSLFADAIVHCTGFKYSFPFLETNDCVSIDENRVGPLYKHVFPPHLAPNLSFVGLPNKAILYLMMELQSKWVAQVLSGKLSLPSEKDMLASVNELYRQMEEARIPKRHTHNLYPNEDKYLNWLVAELGLPPLEEWRHRMYRTVIERIFVHEDGFRDTWDDDYWNQQSQSSNTYAKLQHWNPTIHMNNKPRRVSDTPHCVCNNSIVSPIPSKH